jgi:hypothetical protein
VDALLFASFTLMIFEGDQQACQKLKVKFCKVLVACCQHIVPQMNPYGTNSAILL